MILGDQRRLIVDSFTMFRITDPLTLLPGGRRRRGGLQLRLNAIVSSAIRRALGTRPLPDVLSADRDRIMASIRDQVNSEMSGVRRNRRGRPHPPRRSAAGKHRGGVVAHAVRAPARRRPGAR